jgi:putative ABC transport system substrate-binding protein
MRRREFITLIGGAAAAWPFAAHVQQPGQIRHIGVLVGLASNADDPIAGEILRPFREAMQQAGWIEGKNIGVDYRFGGGDPAKINASAAELVALGPELIYVTGGPPARALHQKTQSIPIVFTQVIDPVGFGLVESIGHPGGNVTGFMAYDP